MKPSPQKKALSLVLADGEIRLIPDATIIDKTGSLTMVKRACGKFIILPTSSIEVMFVGPIR